MRIRRPLAADPICFGLVYVDSSSSSVFGRSPEKVITTHPHPFRCEAYFNGNDADGRSTCLNGSCPAGTEERDGRCHPCDAGAFSSEGALARNVRVEDIH